MNQAALRGGGVEGQSLNSTCGIRRPSPSPGLQNAPVSSSDPSERNPNTILLVAKPSDVTLLLSALADGDRAAADQLLPLLYAELRALAGAMFKDERAAHTLQPTALVHEAFLRLVGTPADSQTAPAASSRAHFLALAAKVMRQVLIDHARARNAAKRNHGQVASNATIALDRTPTPDSAQPDILDLDAALGELAVLYPRAAHVVEMRAFGGLTDPEIATLLGVSRATVERDWTLARNWLKRRLGNPDAEPRTSEGTP